MLLVADVRSELLKVEAHIAALAWPSAVTEEIAVNGSVTVGISIFIKFSTYDPYYLVLSFNWIN